MEILPLLREFSRGKHTLQSASKGCRYHTSLSWQCCTHRKVSGGEDELSHCLFLCPALTRNWFCPNTFFFLFYTKKSLFPPVQDPFSSPKHRLGNKDCWEAAWSGTEEKGMSELGCVDIWGQKAFFIQSACFYPEVPRARTPHPSRGAQQPLPPRALSVHQPLIQVARD